MSRDEETRRQVDPYHLTVSDGGFYLVGYCHLPKTERIFSVERVRELKVLTTRFTVRPGFNAQEYLRQTWGIIKGEIVRPSRATSGTASGTRRRSFGSCPMDGWR